MALLVPSLRRRASHDVDYLPLKLTASPHRHLWPSFSPPSFSSVGRVTSGIPRLRPVPPFGCTALVLGQYGFPKNRSEPSPGVLSGDGRHPRISFKGTDWGLALCSFPTPPSSVPPPAPVEFTAGNSWLSIQNEKTNPSDAGPGQDLGRPDGIEVEGGDSPVSSLPLAVSKTRKGGSEV